MRLIIAGSRNITDYAVVWAAISEALAEFDAPRVACVLSGCANGVDKLGERWAVEHSVPIKPYPAKWDLYGKYAGRLRNAQMACEADALVAVWDGQSPGTKHMIEIAKGKGLLVHVYSTKNENSGANSDVGC